MSARLLRSILPTLLCAAAIWPSGALAQTLPKESPRDWALALQVGGYLPDVDAGVDGGTPFATTFGEKKRLVLQARLERLVFKKFGSLGVGVSGGYSEFFGHALFEDGTRSSDSTSLHVVPLQATATYRFDVLAIEMGIPLVPYGGAGLGGWLWWAGGHNNVQWGYSLSAGLQLLLDTFDRRLAVEFDRETGVNNTYLFVDYTHWGVDGFGGDGPDLSARRGIVSGGIAFEF